MSSRTPHIFALILRVPRHRTTPMGVPTLRAHACWTMILMGDFSEARVMRHKGQSRGTRTVMWVAYRSHLVRNCPHLPKNIPYALFRFIWSVLHQTGGAVEHPLLDWVFYEAGILLKMLLRSYRSDPLPSL